MCFQWFVAPETGTGGSLKRRVRSHLGRWEMKNCIPLWCEAHFECKMYKTHHSRTTLGSKKRTQLWREAHVQVKMYKKHHARTTFGSWDVEKVYAVLAWSTFPSQNVQNIPCLDHLRCDVEKVHAVVARSTFPNQNVKKNTTCSDHFWTFKNRKTYWYEAVSSAFNYPFLKEVSQNCFVFDVVNFENWGSLAELFRFLRCQVQKLRKSRRIAAFLMLPSSKTEEVSQNSLVFKLADTQTDR